MKIHHAATAADLAAQLGALWLAPRPDPFGFDLAVVPSAGFQRWISQQLALHPAAEGISAGIEFLTAARLWSRLAGHDDPWRPERLAWLIQRTVADQTPDPALAVLRAHLDASRETYSASARIASHFAGYAEYAPEMLQHWAHGEDVDPDGKVLSDNAWQPVLWRRLVAATGIDPLQHRAAVLEALRTGPGELPERIAVLAPPRLSTPMMEFFEALSTHHQVDLLLISTAPSRRPSGDRLHRRSLPRIDGHPLNQTLGRLADENACFAPAPHLDPPPRPATLLGWLAEDLFADRRPTRRVLSDHDQSVQVHFSHGPARQVEVLREVLAELYARDTTLEPRHIAVLCPDVDAYGALVDAAFSPQPGAGGHPAQQFRLRLADRTLAQANPLVGLLVTMLQLPDSRLEATSVLELCTTEAVAHRFGFSADDRERLAELVSDSGIRWGLNAAHRAQFGLNGLAHNTWQAGLQRMLLGVTMSEQQLISVGTVLPLDDVDSSDVALIGSLTELIGRLSRWVTEIADPATLGGWVQRCQDGLALLTRLPPASEWQLAELSAGLARLADTDTTDTMIGRHAALRAIEEAFNTTPARGAFGNGSTVVAGLSSLRDVPHRVVIALGWDAERYPRPSRRHGDDLLGDDPVIGAPSAALADRQALLSAIHAAEEHFIVICRGRSEATNEKISPATAIAELLDALDATAATASGTPAGAAVSVQHPLQPFASDYFTGARLRSFDPSAYRAAEAWLEAQSDPVVPRNRFAVESLPGLNLGQGVTLSELADFFRHPARALLKTRAGLSTGEDPNLDDEIPIEPDGLARWQIGNRVLRRLQAGHDAAAIERAEWLRGQVPPFELGHQVMGSILSDARRTVHAAPPPGAVDHHDVSLMVSVPGIDAVPLSGRIGTREHTVWQVEFSALQPRQKISAWLHLLALAAAEPGPWEARVIGKGRQVRYLAPAQAEAAALLGRYLAIYDLGMRRPLPAMPRLTAEWATVRLTGRDPDDPRQHKALHRMWDWESDAAWTKFFAFPELLRLPVGDTIVPGADPAEPSLLGALASAIWTPVMNAEAGQ